VPEVRLSQWRTKLSTAAQTPWQSIGLDPDEQYRLKRIALLKAASRAFARNGYFQTSLADIAREFNLNKATLYHYFKSKEEILFEIHTLAIASVIDREPQPDPTAASGRERLDAFVDSYVNMLLDDFGDCLVLTDVKPLGEESRSQCLAGRRRIDKRLRDILQDGCADGSLAPLDPKTTAFFLFGALNWICRWYRADGEIQRDELKQRAREFVSRAVASGAQATGM